MKKEEIILDLIQNGKSTEEIKGLLNISHKELYNILIKLKRNGYNFLNKCYINGDRNYELINEMFPMLSKNIITSPLDKDIHLMIISDLHFGSFYEDVKLLHSIYDYCTKKDIHVILNAGDFVDGDIKKSGFNNTKIMWNKQINHALRVYPYSEDIYSLLVLGNHDYSLLTNYGLNIADFIRERRCDIIPIGYGEAKIGIKNDFLVMQHPLLCDDMNKVTYAKTIIIKGHGHEAKVTLDTNNLIIYVPSLSHLNFHKSEFPGAIDLNLKMRYGLIEFIELDELAFINNKIHIINSLNLFVGYNKSFRKHAEVFNEENILVKK